MQTLIFHNEGDYELTVPLSRAFHGPLLCCTQWSLSALRVHAAASPPRRRHRRIIDKLSFRKHRHPFTGGRKSNFLLGSMEKAGGLSYCVALPLDCGTCAELVWALSSSVSSHSLIALPVTVPAQVEVPPGPIWALWPRCGGQELC